MPNVGFDHLLSSADFSVFAAGSGLLSGILVFRL